MRKAIHDDIEDANNEAKNRDINKIINPMVRGLWARNIENAIVDTDRVRRVIIML